MYGKQKTSILFFAFIFLFFAFNQANAQNSIALLKYGGGGDWYANPTSLPNLIKFCNSELQTNLEVNHPTIEVGSSEIFLYPLLHLTGHGNVVFSQDEATNLRNYLLAGGFLHMPNSYYQGI